MARTDFKFSYPFRIRYSEIDGQSIVYNSHYLTFFDTAIIEYLETMGYDYTNVVERTGYDYHTVRNVVEYHDVVKYREDIEVCARIARLGNTSLSFVLEIHPAGGDDLRTSGEVVWVHTHQETGKTGPLPKDLLDAVQAFEGNLESSPRP